MFQTLDLVTSMDILCGKLEVCLPLANPSTIYKHFSSLKPLGSLVGSRYYGKNDLNILLPMIKNLGLNLGLALPFGDNSIIEFVYSQA